jgi:hypothetical protein
MCQSNIVIFSSGKYSYGSNEYPIISFDEFRSIKNDQILNTKDCINYILELNTFFPQSTKLEEVPNYLIDLIEFLNDVIFIKSNSNTKKLVLVFEFFEKKINIVLRSFLIGFLKSAQVECNFGFSFIFVLKNTEITSNDSLFISELFKKDLDWFVNNEIILE